MNLLEIRTQFAKLSGRYDLVNSDFTDNGADYFLKAGLKFLDRRVQFDKDVAKFFKQFAIGDYFAEFANYRTTDSVWFADSSGRYELNYLTPKEMQTLYGTEPYVDVTNGTPVYFTMALTRSVPEGQALDVIGNYGDEIAVDGSQTSLQGILVMPPPSIAGQIEVWGKYNTPWPSSDSGTNYWMDSFEDIAVNVGLFKLETSYRNTQGASDWLAAIDLDLMGIEKDTVEDDSDRATEMEG